MPISRTQEQVTFFHPTINYNEYFSEQWAIGAKENKHNITELSNAVCIQVHQGHTVLKPMYSYSRNQEHYELCIYLLKTQMALSHWKSDFLYFNKTIMHKMKGTNRTHI